MDSLDIDLERAETAAARQISRRQNAESSNSSRTASVDLAIARHPTQLSRLYSQRLQHIHTVGSTPGSRAESKAELTPLPAFGAGKPYPPVIRAEREAYVVDFDGPDDPLHPMNWSPRTK